MVNPLLKSVSCVPPHWGTPEKVPGCLPVASLVIRAKLCMLPAGACFGPGSSPGSGPGPGSRPTTPRGQKTTLGR